MKHRTEEVYDEEMVPLIMQLGEIANREGIPLFVTAGLLLACDLHGGDHVHPGVCTRSIFPPNADPALGMFSERFRMCEHITQGSLRVVMLSPSAGSQDEN